MAAPVARHADRRSHGPSKPGDPKAFVAATDRRPCGADSHGDSHGDDTRCYLVAVVDDRPAVGARGVAAERSMYAQRTDF